MDKQRDEFQELIRNFSLNDAQQQRRTPQPSAQRQQPRQQNPARQPYGEAGQASLRGYPPAPSGAGQNVRQNPVYRQNAYQRDVRQEAASQSGYPQQNTRQGVPSQTPPAASGQPQRPQSSVRERLAQRQSAARFDPSGFQPDTPARQPNPAPRPQQPTAPAMQQPTAPPVQPSARTFSQQHIPAQPAASQFHAAGFEMQAQPASVQNPGTAPAVPPPPISRRNFTLNISNPEYQGIPDKSVSPEAAPSSPARFAAAQPPPDPPKPRKRRRRRSGRISRFFEALVLVMGAVACAVFLAIFALQSAGDMLGMNKPDLVAEITIAENATVTDVAEELKEIGIIEQPLTFELYANLLKKNQWEPGTYELNTKMAYSQILNRFIRGNVEQETVRIMFPEGQTIIQIAEKLEENHVCSASDFLKAADTGSFDFQFEDKIPRSSLRFHRLEGYIFPDTYDFYVGQNPESVVRRFLEIFNTRVTQDLYDLMDKRGLTLDETITLASIIQKETGNVENMYRVSSVFHNRLANPGSYPRLQSDATTDYVENTIKPSLSSPNQELFDAYDTYICEGLPAGPINNPGLDAIKAALDPLETGYYFFLSDQKGEYHFSENISQHNAFLASAGEAHGTAIDHSNS